MSTVPSMPSFFTGTVKAYNFFFGPEVADAPVAVGSREGLVGNRQRDFQPRSPLDVEVVVTANRPLAHDSEIAVYNPNTRGRMANGQMYDDDALTVAHPDLPLGTKITLSNGENSVDVVVTDRSNTTFVLSGAAAKALNAKRDDRLEWAYQGHDTEICDEDCEPETEHPALRRQTPVIAADQGFSEDMFAGDMCADPEDCDPTEGLVAECDPNDGLVTADEPAVASSPRRVNRAPTDRDTLGPVGMDSTANEMAEMLMLPATTVEQVEPAESGPVDPFDDSRPWQSRVTHLASLLGSDDEALKDKVFRESGGRPNKSNPRSSAEGWSQFINSSCISAWAKRAVNYTEPEFIEENFEFKIINREKGIGRWVVKDPALEDAILDMRNVLAIDVAMAAEYADYHSQKAQRFLGHYPTAGQQYAMHFLGYGGFKELYKAQKYNPDMPARDVKSLSKAASANPGIFYRNGQPRSAAQVYASLIRTGAGEEPVRVRQRDPELKKIFVAELNKRGIELPSQVRERERIAEEQAKREAEMSRYMAHVIDDSTNTIQQDNTYYNIEPLAVGGFREIPIPSHLDLSSSYELCPDDGSNVSTLLAERQ